ncbi:phosphate transporter [Aspergillus chevalieri]|uniref:Major facilitator superfamily (MFS) profile domain-containing protein n=1 Tax=Aspergillus chevalieri TaxID=182096 RepID=A0A7R7VFC5_ASPCH|nr:uncharacterized protein ACHE_10644A [Aspergillus chevalieri]BCR83242.1 hypothetical protein ACHE_10644A [Aspergillus chevalieri]
MALPMASYVYWQNDASGKQLMCINIATLAGTLLGQVLFGYLADRYGRKKMYGVELTLLITSTLGVVMSSTGVHNSMDVFAWLVWWRVVVGIGVGADYPLSAVITSEFAPTKHRARMLATVFFMQPLGQIAGNLVSMIVVAAGKSHEHETIDSVRSVDSMWRWVIGIGVIPGAIATLFRFAIPESPRFLMEIEDDPVQAEFDATNLFNFTPQSPTSPPATAVSMTSWQDLPMPALSITGHSIEDRASSSQVEMIPPATLNSHWGLTRSDIVQYFWTEGNWRILVATASAWFLMDFGFYGISMSSPQFLAKTWGSLHIRGAAPPWQTDDRPEGNIYQMFLDSSVHGLVILNSGSFFGCLLLILVVHKLDRVGLQKWSFVALAAHFIALGTVFITTQTEGAVAVILYILGQILFNFGPNATTYIIPAEVFPTRYRATCHGISAAFGKLGSILVQVFSAYYRFNPAADRESTIRHGWSLIVFSACMVVGAAVTHFWIPSVQRVNGRGKLWGGKPETLEGLALGRLGGRSRYAGTAKGRVVRPLSYVSYQLG